MYLGIDLGTSSVKLLLLDEEGNIKLTHSEEYPIFYPESGWSEQNPNDWWKSTKKSISEIKEKVDLTSLKGISFSGQMHGLVILDEKDEVIRPAILWNDQRTVKECEFLNSHHIEKYVNNEALTGFTAPKILWVKNNEKENFERIKKIMLPKDYLMYMLSGVHGTDCSDASGMLLLDVKNRKWSKEALEISSVKKEQLAKIFESYEVVGNIKEEIAEELGLPKNVLIVAGGGDQAVGAVGVGAVENGIFSVALGTSGVVFTPTEKFEADEKNRLHSFCDSTGKYHQMGVMLSASASYKWWVETINESKDYELFNRGAEESFKGMEKLFFLPYLMGERTPHNNPNARAGFTGLNINHTKGHMTRAVLEGVGFALNESLELIKNMGVSPKEIRVSGGGAKSRVWKEILSNIFNVEVVTVNSTEGPAYGAAILAAVGCGKYSNIEEACKELISKTETIYPKTDKIEYYQKRYEVFKKIYLGLENIY